MEFLEMRNMLMKQHGWDRRVATLAVRFYKEVDTSVDFQAAMQGDWGYTLLTEGEYRDICEAW